MSNIKDKQNAAIRLGGHEKGNEIEEYWNLINYLNNVTIGDARKICLDSRCFQPSAHAFPSFDRVLNEDADEDLNREIEIELKSILIHFKAFNLKSNDNGVDDVEYNDCYDGIGKNVVNAQDLAQMDDDLLNLSILNHLNYGNIDTRNKMITNDYNADDDENLVDIDEFEMSNHEHEIVQQVANETVDFCHGILDKLTTFNIAVDALASEQEFPKNYIRQSDWQSILNVSQLVLKSTQTEYAKKVFSCSRRRLRNFYRSDNAGDSSRKDIVNSSRKVLKLL